MKAPGVGVWFFPEQPAQELVEAVMHAEVLGMDEVWVGDEGPARDPFVILSAAAANTSTIRLGVGITNPYLRHPGATATTMLTIHELSRGRAVLGIGAGGEISLAPYEVEPTRPVESVRDAVRVTRAVSGKERTDGYVPPEMAVTEESAGAKLPIYIGARSERLNRLASEVADGVFVAGLAPFRYEQVIDWARSTQPVAVALYPSVAFNDEAIEHHRPQLIWALLDSPGHFRERHGLDLAGLTAAAAALRSGDPAPARDQITDDVLSELLLVGSPTEIGEALARLVAFHEPSSVGLALLQEDLADGIESAAEAFDVMRRALGDCVV